MMSTKDDDDEYKRWWWWWVQKMMMISTKDDDDLYKRWWWWIQKMKIMSTKDDDDEYKRWWWWVQKLMMMSTKNAKSPNPLRLDISKIICTVGHRNPPVAGWDSGFPLEWRCTFLEYTFSVELSCGSLGKLLIHSNSDIFTRSPPSGWVLLLGQYLWIYPSGLLNILTVSG